MGKRGIAKSAALVTLMMLAFKVLGFIKQAIIAYYFGASLETDSYFIAWGFVTGISEALVKALSVALVAVYTGILVGQGKREASRIINGLLEIMLPVFGILSAVLLFFSPLFSHLLAPSYQGAQSDLLAKYIQILSPMLLFVCLELVLGAVLDSNKSFFIPRLQSFIYSILTILCCVLLSKAFGVDALILSQYLSSIIFSLVLIVSVRKFHDYFFVKIRNIPELKNILITALPLFIGNSAIQINQIVDKGITSNLGEGVVSSLTYCQTLEQFVTNIMIVNIGNVMFANFAGFVAENRTEEIQRTLSRAINLLISLLLGISIITIINAEDIVSIVYFRGSFSEEAVNLTSLALIGYAISFVGVAIRDLSIKSIYAFKDTRHPMIASILSIIVNIIFSILLSKYIGILGVTIATSISVFVGMIINIFFVKKYLHAYKYSVHAKTLYRCLPGAIALAGICFVFHNCNSVSHLIRFALSSVVGLSVYMIILYTGKVSEIQEVYRKIVLKKKTIHREDDR